ncbi:hypothetical protein ACFP56_14185 [Paenibacillus septentrionalis]|uniref:Uncharacterized protein n=1 Tax=Paenibacillus septentrionalis TaxID=429342 RepID=A0ABW1V840_9BACL
MNMVKDGLLRFVNKPVDNIQSSQTLYETLLTVINMDSLFNDKKYREMSYSIAQLIIKNQLEDGGFDIGYNFSFGKNMKKMNDKESTTPEILSIYALIKFYDTYHEEFVIPSIKKGIDWIKNNSYKTNKMCWVIPYAPCSYTQVHITNGISFAVSTLTYYMAVFQDSSVKGICDGMFRYMREELICHNEVGYWNYFEKDLMKDPYYIKIDNYHIAQQLYYHIQANKFYNNADNYETIEYVSNYLKEKLNHSLNVPYIEVKEKKSTDIHTWGYCALLSCSLYWNDRSKTIEIRDYMYKYMWNQTYFYPVIKGNGIIVENEYYPRSDAWILHSMSDYLTIYNNDEEIRELIDIGLDRLKACNYIGAENHVLTYRKILFNNAVALYKKITMRR